MLATDVVSQTKRAVAVPSGRIDVAPTSVAGTDSVLEGDEIQIGRSDSPTRNVSRIRPVSASTWKPSPWQGAAAHALIGNSLVRFVPSDTRDAVVDRCAVALRLSENVAEHLVGRQLGMTQCRVYALRGAADLPQQVTPVEVLIREAPWVAFERDASARVYDRWFRAHLGQSNVRVRVDIFNAKAAMLRTGIGVGVLPTFMEDRHPELVAVSAPIAELAQPVWMLTHPDLRRTARVRAFMQFVGDALAQRLARTE